MYLTEKKNRKSSLSIMPKLNFNFGRLYNFFKKTIKKAFNFGILALNFGILALNFGIFGMLFFTESVKTINLANFCYHAKVESGTVILYIYILYIILFIIIIIIIIIIIKIRKKKNT